MNANDIRSLSVLFLSTWCIIQAGNKIKSPSLTFTDTDSVFYPAVPLIKKDYPNAKTEDYNKNGVIDTWYIDENKNGKIDMALLDDNEDGIIEAILIDDNENGVWETQIIDDDLNGKPDRAFIDENEDKTPDVVAYDTDQDGTWDKYEKIN